MDSRITAGSVTPTDIEMLEPSGPVEPAPPRVFDPQRILALCNGNPDLAREMSDLFGESARTLVGELKDAVAAADADAVHRVAHTLKGATANLSGDRLAATARCLMSLGEHRELHKAPEVVVQLEDDLAQLEQALAGFVGELAGRAALCAS